MNQLDFSAIVKAYNQIREIPYGIVQLENSKPDGAYEITNLNMGSCTPKHFLLGQIFEKIGLEVRYFSFEFKWCDLPVNLTKKLKSLSERLPNDYHFALKVKINKSWELVDATWDPILYNFGFPGINNWNGMDSTPNAVIPIREIQHNSASERIELLTCLENSFSKMQRHLNQEFIFEFNKCLNELRLGKG
jgi:hypothetical protein